MNKQKLIKRYFVFLLEKGFSYTIIKHDSIGFDYQFNYDNKINIILSEDYRRDYLGLYIEKPLNNRIFGITYETIEQNKGFEGALELKQKLLDIRKTDLKNRYSYSDKAFIEIVQLYVDFIQKNRTYIQKS